MNEEEKKAIEDINRFANGIDMSCVTARQMQIILNLIKKLQKENKTLKSFVSGVVNENIEKDFIPIQEVKDKIEEVRNMKFRDYSLNGTTIDFAIIKFKELLERRNK